MSNFASSFRCLSARNCSMFDMVMTAVILLLWLTIGAASNELKRPNTASAESEAIMIWSKALRADCLSRGPKSSENTASDVDDDAAERPKRNTADSFD